ncbi:hypothetical protein RHS04_05421 [Rhizoctonia solani]|uniref:Uncharacterized protein n=1 Tax=Rhizoctonia solani TaxID=456999 RepID=A0A8H7H620_9AGAM|nr:hypothetical protein RHS04_05421 [Rhizoctonia solani]
MAPVTVRKAKKSSTKFKSSKNTEVNQTPIPKRVTKGFRVPFDHHEWTRLVQAWDSSGESGRPTKSTRIALAADFGRCLKQVNNFYTNRRQDVTNLKRDLGREVTEEEVDSLLWAKYKGTVEERQEAKQKVPSICASSGSSSKSSSPAPSLITSEYSSGDGANSESSVESVSSVDPFSTKSSYSQWLATITPAMAALLMVVDEKLAELELSKGANSF